MLCKKRKVKYSEKKKKSKYPPISFQIFERWCKRCGICIELCPHNVFVEDEMGFPRAVKPIECNLCYFCETHCPDLALVIKTNSLKI